MELIELPSLQGVERQCVQALAGRPGVRSVALMGSMAKRTPAIDAETGRIASDVDLVVTVAAWAFPLFVARQQRLQQALSRDLGLPCTVAPLTLGKIKRAERSVWFTEVKFGGRTIHGPRDLDLIPVQHPRDVEPFQAIVVGCNYLQELARILPDGAVAQPATVSRLGRCMLAATDVVTAATGRYAVDLADRTEAVLADVGLGDAAFAAKVRAGVREGMELRASVRPLAPDAYHPVWRRAVGLLIASVHAAALHLAEGNPDAATALPRLLEQRHRRRASLQFALLSSARARRPRRVPAAPWRLRLQLIENLREMCASQVGDPSWRDAARRNEGVLGHWRAAFPAYDLL